ncbi:MAG: hypothetical protein KGI84_04315 [Elusimicrobia bacterium]|nr:hypothetical protein [Elusimicrobiota bacterium]
MAEVKRQQQQLDATFKRAGGIDADPELLSDFARYLCVLVSGFLEQAVIEILLEYARLHSDERIQLNIERRLRRLTNVKANRLLETVGSFDKDWYHSLEPILVDQNKAALDSIVALRNKIAHGQYVDITLNRVSDYYHCIKVVVDEVARICV